MGAGKKAAKGPVQDTAGNQPAEARAESNQVRTQNSGVKGKFKPSAVQKLGKRHYIKPDPSNR